MIRSQKMGPALLLFLIIIIYFELSFSEHINEEGKSLSSLRLAHTNWAPLHDCLFLIGANTDSPGNYQIPQGQS